MSHSLPHFDYEEVFSKALLIRRCEEKVVELYPSDIIQSPVHLSLGQEHVISAVTSAMGTRGHYFSTYRSHGLYLAAGGDLEEFFAELFGRSTGVAKGKGGSMHLFSTKHNVFGSSAIVAAPISHSVGFAFGLKVQKQKGLAVAVIGDGALEEGTFFESLNLATLKGLPLLFIVEDNGLAINALRRSRQSFTTQKVAEAFSVPSMRIDDGFDFKKIFESTQQLVEKIDSTQKPAILEIQTHRYAEHVGIGANASGDLEFWKARDPLILNQDLCLKFDARIQQRIDTAVNAARLAPFPVASELTRDVYD